MEQKNFLVTGPPRCGKSTLIEAVCRGISVPMTGFFTKEIIARGHRVGFRIVTLDGQEGVLAHEQIKGRHRVGRYGVSLEDMEGIAVPSMAPPDPESIVIVDEIGKMECYSELFRETLIRTLNSRNKVLASIALKGGPFIDRVKSRSDVRLMEVSEQNRGALVRVLIEALTK